MASRERVGGFCDLAMTTTTLVSCHGYGDEQLDEPEDDSRPHEVAVGVASAANEVAVGVASAAHEVAVGAASAANEQPA